LMEFWCCWRLGGVWSCLRTNTGGELLCMHWLLFICAFLFRFMRTARTQIYCAQANSGHGISRSKHLSRSTQQRASKMFMSLRVPAQTRIPTKDWQRDSSTRERALDTPTKQQPLAWRSLTLHETTSCHKRLPTANSTGVIQRPAQLTTQAFEPRHSAQNYTKYQLTCAQQSTDLQVL
jgi:hypothetical protein